MSATLRTDSEVAIMSKEQGRDEIVFQITMSAARKMLERGMISKEEYREFDKKMQQKYNLVFGGLFSKIDLL